VLTIKANKKATATLKLKAIKRIITLMKNIPIESSKLLWCWLAKHEESQDAN
jgi:hypothetical protein